MHCLLVASTAPEVASFMEFYRNSPKTLHVECKVDLLITGIGATAAAYHITHRLGKKKYDVVIQAGVAGCYDKRFSLSDVVVIGHETEADLGVLEKTGFQSAFDLKLMKANDAPYTQKKLKNPHLPWLKRTRLKVVPGITVNQITSSRKQVQLFAGKYNPVAESMEGAALHYVCLNENIPFLQIRSFSNYAGERNKKKWALEKAIDQLNRELIRLVQSL